jgi:ribosome-binding factor A
MKQQRINKIESLILRAMGDILIKEKDTLVGNNIVSVTFVKISPDLSLARIYLSIFPVEKREEILAYFEANKKYIRKLLGERIRNIRKIPELRFFIDDSYDQINRIDELLKNG